MCWPLLRSAIWANCTVVSYTDFRNSPSVGVNIETFVEETHYHCPKEPHCGLRYTENSDHLAKYPACKQWSHSDTRRKAPRFLRAFPPSKSVTGAVNKGHIIRWLVMVRLNCVHQLYGRMSIRIAHVAGLLGKYREEVLYWWLLL